MHKKKSLKTSKNNKHFLKLNESKHVNFLIFLNN